MRKNAGDESSVLINSVEMQTKILQFNCSCKSVHAMKTVSPKFCSKYSEAGLRGGDDLDFVEARP